MVYDVYVIGSLLPICLLLMRAVYLIYKIMTAECSLESQKSFKTIICIGSGGHTTEMLRIMKHFDKNKYKERLYILAANDTSSEVKIHKLENEFQSLDSDYTIARIPRSRNVKQSFVSSIPTTMHSTISTLPIVYNFKPDVIFCNGPGTCIPVCILAFVMRCLFLSESRIVFVESICRVRTMSLTGNILKWFADIIVVQWPYLRNVCSRSKYFGRLT